MWDDLTGYFCHCEVSTMVALASHASQDESGLLCCDPTASERHFLLARCTGSSFQSCIIFYFVDAALWVMFGKRYLVILLRYTNK
jgi:hypothetical protein